MEIGVYQLLLPLRDEEYEALKTDIAKRGVMVPIEVDEHGVVLDGHNRVAICAELGLPDPPRLVRSGFDEHQKREHILKLNLARRHLDPLRWGQAFAQLLTERGVERGQGSRNELTRATVAQVGEEVGVSHRTAKWRLRQWDDLQALPESVQGQVLAGSTTVGAAKRDQTRKANREAVAAMPEPIAPVERYRCIVLDPPWDPADEGDIDQMGRAQPTYATMPIDEIAALPIPEWADAGGCHLYMWITNRSLPKGFDLLASWGFRYVTALTWCKPGLGVGNYFRNNTEHVLFGIRGSLPLTEQDVGTWFAWARGPLHSSKPDEFYAMVRRVSPPPRFSYFERTGRPGFVVGGAEA